MTSDEKEKKRRPEDLVRAGRLERVLHETVTQRAESSLIDARTRAAIRRDPALSRLDPGVVCSLLKALAANRDRSMTTCLLDLARSSDFGALAAKTQRELLNLLGLG